MKRIQFVCVCVCPASQSVKGGPSQSVGMKGDRQEWVERRNQRKRKQASVNERFVVVDDDDGQADLGPQVRSRCTAETKAVRAIDR